MNYIKHLTGFFNKSNQDKTISPTHISLYLALFQRWNLNRFKNPIIISREEIMITSKIKSKATYHKCMRELHEKYYIVYKPSYNPYEGTEVILPDLSLMSKETTEDVTSSNFDQSKPDNELPKSETSSNFDSTTPKNELQTPKIGKKSATSSNFDQSESNNELLKSLTRLKNERTKLKNSQVNEQVNIYNNNKTLENSIKTIYTPEEKIEKNKSKFIEPNIELIKEFFQEKKVSSIEADKYFNYYSSNGWKVGGKTPMKDWQAAARNWILNLDKFKTNKPSNQLSPKNLNISNNKDYAEPL